MAGNSFGQIFRVTTFGESHGPMIGVVIDGCPAGLPIDAEFVAQQMRRRRPGQSKITSQRKETDDVQFVSGIFNGKTTGTPIAALINNSDTRSKDYEHLKDNYRPSHADFTYDAKFGHRDYRGGGRASARETAARVVAGAIAQLLIRQKGIRVTAFVSQVGPIRLVIPYDQLDLALAEQNPVRCPDLETAKQMQDYIETVRKKGDTTGGVITAVITGCPPGLGEPVFDRFHADLGKAMLSINAAKGFEYGSGFDGVAMNGSAHNDLFYIDDDGQVRTRTNLSGGIQGGITNGMDIYFNVAFKPVATILKPQPSVNRNGQSVTLEGRGRHDPCVVSRAVPIVEAMAALVLADHLLRQRLALADEGSKI